MELDNTTATPAELLEQVNKAITTVLVGGQSYRIGSRQLTRADLAMLKTSGRPGGTTGGRRKRSPAGAHLRGHFSRGGKTVGFIDNVIAAVSPKKHTSGRRGAKGWRLCADMTRPGSAGSIPGGGHTTRARRSQTDTAGTWYARARDLERNSDILQAVVLAYKRNVVGKGFTSGQGPGTTT